MTARLTDWIVKETRQPAEQICRAPVHRDGAGNVGSREGTGTHAELPARTDPVDHQQAWPYHGCDGDQPPPSDDQAGKQKARDHGS